MVGALVLDLPFCDSFVITTLLGNTFECFFSSYYCHLVNSQKDHVKVSNSSFKSKGHLVGSPGWLNRLNFWLLVLAQVIISGSWDGAPSWALHSAQSLLVPSPLPLSLTLLVPSLSLSNKTLKNQKPKNKGHLAIPVWWLISICTPTPHKSILYPLSCSTPGEIDYYWRHHLVFLLVDLWLKLFNGRLGLASDSGSLLDLVKRKHRQEVLGVGGWNISSQLPPCFGMESLAVVSLHQVSSSFWEAHSLWLQFSLGSKSTISSLHPFSPRSHNGFPLLLVSKYLIVPYLFPYPYPHFYKDFGSLQWSF